MWKRRREMREGELTVNIFERSKERRSFKRLKFGIHEERRFSYFDPTILAKTGVGKNLVSVSTEMSQLLV
jgi:hypothetical protein